MFMPDLVGRKFTANEPNRVYVGDITYLPGKGGKNMYLATVIDTYSRKLHRLCARRPHACVTEFGQIHVLVTLTGQVCNVANIDAVRLVGCEFTAY